MLRKSEFFFYSLKAHEISQLSHIDAKIFGDNPWNYEQWINEREFSHITIAKNNQDEIIGYISFSHSIDEMELRKIAVISQYQNKGLGSLLMKILLKESKRKNVEKIFLDVEVENKKAICFYKKWNFIEYGTRPRYYRNGADAILMVRYISSAALPPPPEK